MLKTDKKPRVFEGQCKFADGTATVKFQVQSFSAEAAAAKLAGIISDQPKEVVAFHLEETTVSRIMQVKRMPPRIILNGH